MRQRFAAVVAVLLVCSTAAIAQIPATREGRPTAPLAPRPAPDAPLPASEPRDPFDDMRRLDPAFHDRAWYRGITRVGTDYRLAPGEEVGEIGVFSANAVIEGTVDREATIIFGDVELGSSAVIQRTLSVIGGALRIHDGAKVNGDLVLIGGTLEAPASFAAGGDHFVVDSRAFNGRMQAAVDWVSRGLVLGRLIVPGIGWMIPVVLLWLMLSLVISLLLEKPIAASTDALSAKPLTSSLVGLLVLLLAGPICVLLAVSVIGLAVVPFVLCGLLIAMIVGKLAVTRRIGRGVLFEDTPAPRSQALRSTAIGLGVLTLTYMVPVLGIVVWTLGGVFGIGAAALAFLASYRKENPLPAPRRVFIPTPVAAPAVAVSMPSDSASDNAPGASAASFVSGGVEGAPVFDTAWTPPPPMPDVNGTSLLAFPRASFRDRLLAGILDAILLVVLGNVFDRIFRDEGIFLLILAYFIGFWAWKGTTVGGIILQLRVVRMDGRPLGFAEALVRALSSFFSAIVVGIGFLWILRDPERQAWHDRIAGTYVVKVPRHWPI